MKQIGEINKMSEKNKTWLNKMDVWIYDEIVRQFRDAGYSWKKAQKKADIIMGVATNQDIKKLWNWSLKVKENL